MRESPAMMLDPLQVHAADDRREELIQPGLQNINKNAFFPCWWHAAKVKCGEVNWGMLHRYTAQQFSARNEKCLAVRAREGIEECRLLIPVVQPEFELR